LNAKSDVLTGFIKQNGDAMGRPVGVAIDSRDALLVADDVGNTIWRVTRSEPASKSIASHQGDATRFRIKSGIPQKPQCAQSRRGPLVQSPEIRVESTNDR
jgi:hypothetical protein